MPTRTLRFAFENKPWRFGLARFASVAFAFSVPSYSYHRVSSIPLFDSLNKKTADLVRQLRRQGCVKRGQRGGWQLDDDGGML